MSVSGIFAMGKDCGCGHYPYEGYYYSGHRPRVDHTSYNYHGYYRNYYYHRGLL